eukprot:10843999-Alexandrium_andersonii.AAC.1
MAGATMYAPQHCPVDLCSNQYRSCHACRQSTEPAGLPRHPRRPQHSPLPQTVETPHASAA